MDTLEKILFVILLISILLLVSFMIYFIIDVAYVMPIVDDKANNHCKQLGFDQYKSYSRVGLWSENPIGIKCEYAEKYTDLGVRT